MRIEFDLESDGQSLSEIQDQFVTIASRFDLHWRMELAERRKRMAIFVSKVEHCLLELLWKWRSGELHVDVPLVISNHPDHRQMVESYGIPFFSIFPLRSSRKNKRSKKLLPFFNVTGSTLSSLLAICKFYQKNLSKHFQSELLTSTTLFFTSLHWR